MTSLVEVNFILRFLEKIKDLIKANTIKNDFNYNSRANKKTSTWNIFLKETALTRLSKK